MGSYKGVRFIKRRLCDVIYGSRLRSCWYWILDKGIPTGDHFKTQREMRQWIDDRVDD
jgi:hypothetical protein